MELPIVAPAPVVTEHVVVFRDLFDTHCQLRHFHHDLTGLIVLPHKHLATVARDIVDSVGRGGHRAIGHRAESRLAVGHPGR
jgi:hypothetical protein